MDVTASAYDRYYPDDLFYDSDSEGLSDDNEYYEFKEKLKKNQKQFTAVVETEEDRKKKQLRTVFSAITHERVDTVFTEIDNGLDINADLESGWTPLLLSATIGNIDILSGLIKKGADITRTREDGITPLMLLCNINSTEKNIQSCVQFLLENNCDPNAIDNKRRTAIMLAAHNGHLEVVKLLLPLVDKEAEDNQRWNVLFWAVDGNSEDVVKFLLSTGEFNIEKTDIRGNTAVDLANSNGFQNIVELFPKDPVVEFYLYLNNNQLNFEETFNNLGKNKKPQFFSDVCNILYGTRSESVMPIFFEQNIDLFEFLSLNERKLEELGVQFPYQRNRIMGGIYKFHKRPFRPQSIPFVKKDNLYTNIDVSTSVLTSIKQLIAMEASLKFIMENSQGKLPLAESKEVRILISRCRSSILRLKGVTEQLSKKSQKWDLLLKPADKITKKRRNIPWSNVFLSLGVISVSLIILYKMK